LSKKRIALCLHGQARGLCLFSEYSPLSIEYQNKNLIHRNDIDVDVFFHTWDYSSSLSDFKQKIIDLYHPKAFSFEETLNKNLVEKFKDGSTPDQYVYSNYSHYHSLYFSDLKRKEYEFENKIEYDWVISTRFDVALNVKIDFSVLDNTKIYQSDFNKSTYMSNGFRVQNPVFTIGSGSNIEKHSSIILNISKLINICGNIDGHSVFGANIKNLDLIDHMMYFDMNHPFAPDKYGASHHSFVRNDIEIFRNL
jgi:hypothetical protein